jgi:hypothetical protein
MLLSGCTRDGQFQPNDMWNKSRLKPYEPIGLAEGVEVSASRPLPDGTIARGQLRIDEAMYNGTLNGRLVTTIPAAAMRGVTMRQLAERGKSATTSTACRARNRGQRRRHGDEARHGRATVLFAAAPAHCADWSLLRCNHKRLRRDVFLCGACSATLTVGRFASYIRVLQRSQSASQADIPASERANVKTPEQILGAREPMSQTPVCPARWHCRTRRRNLLASRRPVRMTRRGSPLTKRSA